jgi:hypothetical protein
MNNNNPEHSNIRAAMDKVAESLEPTISPTNNPDDGPADKQVLIRTNEVERDRWKSAADHEGMTLSAWIRKALNDSASNILDCPHPMELIRFYPWAGGKKVCTRCRQRL